MAVLNKTAKIAMVLGWIAASALAYLVWKMPANWVVGASINGVLVATNILIIIFGAIALYHTMRESGAIKHVIELVTGLSPDRRIQALFAWLLAAFVEGIAGFGTPGALVAPLLVSLGFPARIAVPLVLIFNSTPVSFGAVGLPTFGGVGYTLDVPSINAFMSGAGIDYWHWINHMVTTAVASIHGIIGIFVPLMGITFLVKWSGGKWGDIVKAVPAALLGGIAFVVPYFFVASLMGPELASVLGGLIGILIYTLILKAGMFRFEKPYQFAGETLTETSTIPDTGFKPGLLRALIPYVLISLILIMTRVISQINDFCTSHVILSWKNILGTSINFSFQSMYNPGVYFILVVLLSHYLFRMDRTRIKAVWGSTIKSLIPAAIALWFAVALSQVMILSGNNVSGMASMVSLIAHAAADIAKGAYPIISPFVGILGAYVAGSNTVSNIMMVGFQYETASVLGISRTIIVALQDVGGAIGNMICVHNIVAVCAVVGIIGQEGSIIRRNLLPALVYGLTAGVIGYIVIHAVPGVL
jgi:lactate permease